MTIRQFEILLYLRKNDTAKFGVILEKINNCITLASSKTNIDALYSELNINDNPHLKGEMDYFQKQMKHFEANLK